MVERTNRYDPEELRVVGVPETCTKVRRTSHKRRSSRDERRSEGKVEKD